MHSAGQERKMKRLSEWDGRANRFAYALLRRFALVGCVCAAMVVNQRAVQAQIPDPPLPTDPRPLSELLSAADKALLADSDNPKKLVEAYLKISEAHLQAAFNAIKADNHVAAETELNIYNKAAAAAGKEAFALQQGKRSASKRIEQSLYKQIKTLETIEALFPSERGMYAEAALKQAKQLRVQALNEAFASGDVIKDPEGDKKNPEGDKKDPEGDKKPENQSSNKDGAAVAPSTLQSPAGVESSPVRKRGFLSLIFLRPVRTEALNSSEATQQRGDYLTEEEDDHVREAQAADMRAKVFMKIADRRLKAIVEPAPAPVDKKEQKKVEEELREWGAVPKVSRQELLRHYARAVAECMAKLEDAYERNPKSTALPKALSVLRDATDKHLEMLRKLKPEMKTDDEMAAMGSAIYEAETANKGAREGLK
jgi:hypothetical protein